jgi:hypothetical protein
MVAGGKDAREKKAEHTVPQSSHKRREETAKETHATPEQPAKRVKHVSEEAEATKGQAEGGADEASARAAMLEEGKVVFLFR